MGRLTRGSYISDELLFRIVAKIPTSVLEECRVTAVGRCRAGAGSPRTHQPHPGYQVAEPLLPAPGNRRLGEGQRLTPDTPRNGGRPPPQGTAPHHTRGTQPPQGMQAKGTVLGPHARTPAPTARG